MKARIKKLAALGISPLTPFIWRLKRSPYLLILAYHRVLPPEHPDRLTEQPGMYVSPDTLSMHIKLLKSHFDIVTVEEWAHRSTSNKPLPARACALTFDDGWRDNLEYAFPILRAERVPATMYVVTDLVGTVYDFWPNRIARLLGNRDMLDARHWPAWFTEILRGVTKASTERRALSAEEIDRVITTCKFHFTDDSMFELLKILETDETSVPHRARRNLLSWDEIRTLSDSGIFSFGSHTRRHRRLTSNLSTPVLKDEICESRRILEDRLGKPVESFCYPNGDFCTAALELVQVSYCAAVTMQRGTNSPNSARHLMQRVGIHDAASSTKPAFLSWIARAYIH